MLEPKLLGNECERIVRAWGRMQERGERERERSGGTREGEGRTKGG